MLVQVGVEEAPVVVVLTEAVGTTAGLDAALVDPATAETTSIAGASKVCAAGIDEDSPDVTDGAATGVKDG